jgi:1-deoxy-D-xylulose-5-phosphate synthase
LGIALAKRRKKEQGRVIAIIGDGALTSGLAFEGLNQAGYLGEDLIVILNDNGMSIAPNVGALSRFMARAISGKAYQSFRREMRRILKSMPGIGEDLLNIARRSEESIKVLSTPGILFEAFKFNYVGPVDGHNIQRLIDTMENLKDTSGPVLVHVLTQKGRGFTPAEENPSQFHGISAHFKSTPSDQSENSVEGNYPLAPLAPSFTQIFGQSLLELARNNPRIIAISAAMTTGTGLTEIAQQLPEQFIDVGIAEQHAVTMAAGLASQGMQPVVAIYSTFAQRAFDQILHDVCIPNLPVVLALDRAGIVGEDGVTHQGLFDISFLRCLPNISLLAAADANELKHMLFTALTRKTPVAIRYPRGTGMNVPVEANFQELPWGKGQLVREGKDILIVSIGHSLQAARHAVQILSGKNIEAALINARFVKPLDEELILYWAERCGRVLTVEENIAAGGFGSAVLESLHRHGILPPLSMVAIDDIFVEHGPQALVRDMLGLSGHGIAQKALQLL